MLSWSVLSSRYHEVWSLADAPAVGSGAPRTMLIGEGCGDKSMSSSRCAVGRICCGSSLIKYCANFCNCSRCSRDNDSLTGARKHTCCGCKTHISSNTQISYNFKLCKRRNKRKKIMILGLLHNFLGNHVNCIITLLGFQKLSDFLAISK